MVTALFACASGGTTDPTPPPADTAAPDPGGEATTPAPPSAAPVAPPEEEQLGTDPLDKVGFYDPTYDYTQNKKFKVSYMVIGMSVFNNDFDNAYKQWASLANVDYTGIYSAADNDALITQLTAFKDQGYDGVLLDPDMMTYPRISEVCNEIGLPWMGGMGQAIKFDDNMVPAGLLHPYVGFDHITYGIMCAQKLIEYKNEAWSDVDWTKVGFLGIDMTTSPPLAQRVEGARIEWSSNPVTAALAANFVTVDTASGMMDIDTANNLATAAISSHPEFTHWLILGVIDDFAQGAAMALDNLGMTDNGCAVSVGGTAQRTQWDVGQQDAWRFSLTTAGIIYGEPIFFALYAFMSGQATPETIWPSWINHNPAVAPLFGETYAQLMLPSWWQDFDNYKHIQAWSDVYSNSSLSGYPTDGVGRDDFYARVAIPDSYKAA
jgi:ABC-type sugar transport system substrate-binding protein